MPRTEKSVAFLTGLIVAALYVILLVGFSRESYMRRDADALAEAPRGYNLAGDATSRLCRTDRLACGPASWRADGGIPRPPVASADGPPPR